MEMVVLNNFFKSKVATKKLVNSEKKTNLTHGEINIPYKIKNISTDDKEMEKFLFTLGCYEGEKITVISVLSDNYIINIKDARYSIDSDLAKAILI